MSEEGEYVILNYRDYRKLKKRAKKRNSTIEKEVDIILRKCLDEE
ncbi:hypothetical protein LCGC14_0540400 [marine sediment metagenome]|uniref:Uncharacterized protein n=1 Tax=marine sediment metagenome TaxID=412755 RepID=A0A0F9V1A0_9ZZZZ